eukprot:TRINITY_DN6192_c0_g1_i2.p1 TRINITY_DN6192_c0_g1~~TRINITY_DN6192_c0_g1_i2.p1  ORF type:complete len:491 (-),score=55.52 TRINITY_DN6192_c0_g1_i2:60-1532(-)
MASPEVPIYWITAVFFTLVLLVATQDIAVDGWALTLLAKDKLSYASTCQTLGINTGYFLSYTVFLALNSPDFCNAYLRPAGEAQDVGVLSLSTYIQSLALLYGVVTLLLAVFKQERLVENGEHEYSYKDDEDYTNQNKDAVPHTNLDDLTVKQVYATIWEITKLPNVRLLLFMLLIYKIGFMSADSVSALKLIEKGFKKEDLASFALLEFPFQILFAVIAGKWANSDTPLSAWMTCYKIRIGIAVAVPVIIYYFPQGPITTSYYLLVLSVVLLSSFSSTIMFVCQGGFFNRISDSRIGGTYLTLLNTFSNFGTTWPRFFVLYFLDQLTVQSCVHPETGAVLSTAKGSGICKSGQRVCFSTNANGVQQEGICRLDSDGYYLIAALCVLIGIFVFFYLSRNLLPLQRLKESAWSVPVLPYSKTKPLDIESGVSTTLPSLGSTTAAHLISTALPSSGPTAIPFPLLDPKSSTSQISDSLSSTTTTTTQRWHRE